MVGHGCSHQALHRRARHLGMGQQRQGRRPRRGDGLLRRRAHAGDPGCGHDTAAAFPGTEDPRHQRGGFDGAAAAKRASSRTGRQDFEGPCTRDKPIIFAFLGYPWLIHRLAYRRTNHKNLHVRGYKENGTTTTPFDMAVLNDLDRFHLAGDVIDRVPSLGSRAAYAKQFLRDKLLDHKAYIDIHGEDMPEIRNWKWSVRIR